MWPQRNSVWLLYYIIVSFSYIKSFLHANFTWNPKKITVQEKSGFYCHLSYTENGIIIVTMSKSKGRSFYLMHFIYPFVLQVKTKLNETITGSFV